nr:DUF1738 domain-containing protein [Clostridia bacterium]
MDIYATVTERIIAQLEQGQIPWQKPWISAGKAISHATGKPYSLLNQMLLQRPGEYITFKQCTEAGGHIKKGEKANLVVFWKWIEQEDEETGKTKEVPFLRYYNVFHIDQCEGIAARFRASEPPIITPAAANDAAEDIIADYLHRSGVRLVSRESSEAFYRPATDTVVLPLMKQFSETAEYYSTAFHELTHSTGHPSRLTRLARPSFFGSDNYSKEELVAEIGAAALVCHVGLETSTSFRNNAAYIQNWLNVLRGEMGFEGMVVTDYDVINMRGWGVETLTETEHCFKVIEAGCDKIGSYNQVQPIRDAFQTYADKYGAEAMETRVRESAKRILVNMIHLGLLDNPYLEAAASNKALKGKDREEVAYIAQLDSIVMVKNSTNMIQERTSKPTVYIPMEYTAATVGNESSPGSAASAGLPIDSRTAAQYFNIVTDTLAATYTGPADEDGNPTLSEADIIRASEEEIAACDFVLLFISNPSNSGGGYDSTTGKYLPISLQYGTYTANSIFVPQTSLGGDQQKVEVQDTYGAQTIITTENRSYYGNTTNISNPNELDQIHYYSSFCENVVVVISASNPMIFSEFESEVETILMQFGGVGDEALCKIIGGKYEPKGLLPLQMPANMDTVEMQYSDVPRDMECHVDSEGNVYDFAFGLNWSGVINDERVEKYSVPAIEYYDEYVK